LYFCVTNKFDLIDLIYKCFDREFFLSLIKSLSIALYEPTLKHLSRSGHNLAGSFDYRKISAAGPLPSGRHFSFNFLCRQND